MSSLGYRHTPEAKAKISAAFKGRPSTVKGLHWKLSEETKKKMSEHKKGKPNLAWSGDKNPRWKGGVSKKNKGARQLAMETLEYRNWRRQVFERDGYKCVMCGDDKGGNLEADHIVPVALRPELMLDVDNGRTLCKIDHQKVTVEFNRLYWKNQFGTHYPQRPAATCRRSGKI